VEFLSQLRSNGEYVSAITGNLEEPARLILDRAGLTHFFDYLIFDDGKSERKQIVQRAVDEAKQRMYDFNKIVVIGDTTYDIEAGKHVKAFTVGVGSGSDDLEKLWAKNPDFLLPDLTYYKRILEALK
jgi:phosphoglycolate phosphatase-like HAD superfamily hydrolase